MTFLKGILIWWKLWKHFPAVPELFLCSATQPPRVLGSPQHSSKLLRHSLFSEPVCHLARWHGCSFCKHMLAPLDHICKGLKSNEQTLKHCGLNGEVLYQLPRTSTDTHSFHEYLLSPYYVPTTEWCTRQTWNLWWEMNNRQVNTQDVFSVLSALKKIK